MTHDLYGNQGGENFEMQRKALNFCGSEVFTVINPNSF
jgi:hypothetical protein